MFLASTVHIANAFSIEFCFALAPTTIRRILLFPSNIETTTNAKHKVCVPMRFHRHAAGHERSTMEQIPPEIMAKDPQFLDIPTSIELARCNLDLQQTVY